MRYFVRNVRAARWPGTTPVTDEMQNEARQDFRLRDKDKHDGLSICEVDSDRDADHHLFVAATAADRTKLDDDYVGVLVISDDDLKDLGGVIDSNSESCVVDVREKHRALNWDQETLHRLADRLLARGRTARRFSKAEVRQIFLGLRKEQVACDDVWAHIQEHRIDWEEQARKQAEHEKRKEAAREKHERQGGADRKQRPRVELAIPLPDPPAPPEDVAAVPHEPPAREADAAPQPEHPVVQPDLRRAANRNSVAVFAIAAIAIVMLLAWLLFR